MKLELNEIPEDLYLYIQKNAAIHKRSINSEILFFLRSQMKNSAIHSPNKHDHNKLVSADELRALLAPDDEQ